MSSHDSALGRGGGLGGMALCEYCIPLHQTETRVRRHCTSDTLPQRRHGDRRVASYKRIRNIRVRMQAGNGLAYYYLRGRYHHHHLYHKETISKQLIYAIHTIRLSAVPTVRRTTLYSESHQHLGSTSSCRYWRPTCGTSQQPHPNTHASTQSRSQSSFSQAASINQKMQKPKHVNKVKG